MPVFNCEKTVGIAVRSILNQTYTDWELLVIDDGSSDRTVQIAGSFGDERIRIFTDGEHKTLAPRLNEAVSLSRGEYFARMDGDDVSYPERLELQVEFLERNPGIDLLGAGVVVFRGEGQLLGTHSVPQAHDEICRHPRSGFCLAHPTWIGRTAWFLKHPYRPDAVRCEDQDLLLRTYQVSRFAALPQALLGYREEKISLRRILSGRRHFGVSVARAAFMTRRYDVATAVILEQLAKAAVDTFAVLSGLNYLVLRHRALPADGRTRQRWVEVWAELEERLTLQREPRTSQVGASAQGPLGTPNTAGTASRSRCSSPSGGSRT